MVRVKIALLAAMVAGCSSPPPPTPVEWSKDAEAVNTTLPQWNDNSVIIPSHAVTGKWTSAITTQNPYDTAWSPAVYFAAAHSTRIVVTAQSGADFFIAKNWLCQNGAKGVIEYQPSINCLTCRETTIYFSR